MGECMNRQFKYTIASALACACLATTTLSPLASINTVAAESSVADEIASSEYTEKEKLENGLALLNYLTVLSQEVTSSKNSRLKLEEISDEIFDNLLPGVIDDDTQDRIRNIQTTIESYRMVDVQRERVQYLYEQEQAASMPSPVGLLSVVQSENLVDLALSTAYMAMDTYTNYKNAQNEAEINLLKQNWELDDSQMKALAADRQDTFDYMVTIAKKYGGLKNVPTLNQPLVEEFVEIKNDTNNKSRIKSLESSTSKKNYRLFGSYWLLLAESYYTDHQYQKCLDAFDEYENLGIHIFRDDKELANDIPVALAACQELYSSKDMNKAEYRERLTHYAELLDENTQDSDWQLRYVEAQTYITLYQLMKNQSHIDKAYELLSTNVNELAKEQKNENKSYLSDLDLMTVPKKAGITASETVKEKNKKERSEAEAYNEALETTRKTELTPVNEALKLNVDLMFEVADKASNVSDYEKSSMDEILHKTTLFMNPNLDSLYWFDESGAEQVAVGNIEITFNDGSFDNDDGITIPAKYVGNDATISVTITDNGQTSMYDDWKLIEVIRGKRDKDQKNKPYSDTSTFVARYESATLEDAKLKYSDGAVVKVKIVPGNDDRCVNYEVQYKAVRQKVFFQKIGWGYAFERQ